MIRKFLFYLVILTAPIIGYLSAQSSLPTYNNATQQVLIPVRDAKLFCRTLGKGEPLIVVHGGPGLTQDYLLPEMYKLAENHFVIFYDQRGCGQSIGEINPDTINMAMFVEDLDTIRKAFHFDKISVLGHSWGGFLAMQYAIVHPEAIDKLILANSMPASSDGLALFIKEYGQRTAPYQKQLADIHSSKEFLDGNSKVMEQLYRIIFRTYCYIPEKADMLNLYLTPQAALNGAKVYGYIQQDVFKKHFDLHPLLRKLEMPVLIIHGDYDPIPASTAKNIHESIHGSQYVLMKECGHFPYVEDPDLFFTYVNSFLRPS